MNIRRDKLGQYNNSDKDRTTHGSKVISTPTFPLAVWAGAEVSYRVLRKSVNLTH